jgi:hypothetical protein
MQLYLTGFLEKNTSTFMRHLWAHLISAQGNEHGIPAEFLEKKKEELRKKREEQARTRFLPMLPCVVRAPQINPGVAPALRAPSALLRDIARLLHTDAALPPMRRSASPRPSVPRRRRWKRKSPRKRHACAMRPLRQPRRPQPRAQARRALPCASLACPLRADLRSSARPDATSSGGSVSPIAFVAAAGPTGAARMSGGTTSRRIGVAMRGAAGTMIGVTTGARTGVTIGGMIGGMIGASRVATVGVTGIATRQRMRHALAAAEGQRSAAGGAGRGHHRVPRLKRSLTSLAERDPHEPHRPRPRRPRRRQR